MAKFKALYTATIWTGKDALKVKAGEIYEINDAKVEKLLEKSTTLERVQETPKVAKPKDGGKQ